MIQRLTGIRVDARLVDGSAQDWVFGPEFLAKLDALDVRGVTGKDLIHELLTDDWGAPPIMITVSWVRPDGIRTERNIPYE